MMRFRDFQWLIIIATMRMICVTTWGRDIMDKKEWKSSQKCEVMKIGRYSSFESKMSRLKALKIDNLFWTILINKWAKKKGNMYVLAYVRTYQQCE